MDRDMGCGLGDLCEKRLANEKNKQHVYKINIFIISHEANS